MVGFEWLGEIRKFRPGVGFELTPLRLLVWCSTYWAIQVMVLLPIPSISVFSPSTSEVWVSTKLPPWYLHLLPLTLQSSSEWSMPGTINPDGAPNWIIGCTSHCALEFDVIHPWIVSRNVLRLVLSGWSKSENFDLEWDLNSRLSDN